MNIFRAFVAVGGWTLASRVLGLGRDVIVAAVFGAGAVMDAFFAAFRLPNTLRRFTAEGALTQAFV
ncbi:MAG: lipid II flippase MurJ, partial [Gammaproteobacteria bacterium]